jgi:hypothetical protein
MLKKLNSKINCFISAAAFGSAACLVVIPLVECNKNLVVVLFVLAMIAFGMQAGGDIPIYAGILFKLNGMLIQI